MFPRILVQHEGDVQFANDLLNEAHVTVTPGSAFGPTGGDHVRMAYCVADDDINLAFDRIEAKFWYLSIRSSRVREIGVTRPSAPSAFI